MERLYWRGRHADSRIAMCGVARDLSGDSRPDYEELALELNGFLERPGAEPSAVWRDEVRLGPNSRRRMVWLPCLAIHLTTV